MSAKYTLASKTKELSEKVIIQVLVGVSTFLGLGIYRDEVIICIVPGSMKHQMYLIKKKTFQTILNGSNTKYRNYALRFRDPSNLQSRKMETILLTRSLWGKLKKPSR